MKYIHLILECALTDNSQTHVTHYAADYVDLAVSIMTTADPNSSDGSTVLVPLLETLKAAFMHDEDGFWSAARRFQSISDAVFNLLPRCATMSSDPKDLANLTQRAIAALVYATPAETLRTAINKATVQLLQDEKAAVRIAGVRCQMQIANVCGHQWVTTFLPQLLPYISELQEDDDEAVDKETKRWIKLLEDAKGENLAAMLQ